MPRPLAAVSQGEVDYGRPNCRVNYQAVILGAKLLQLMQLAVVDERIDYADSGTRPNPLPEGLLRPTVSMTPATKMMMSS